MNLEPLRRLQSKLSVAFIAAAALVLSSCGGGGATSSPNTTGALSLTPLTATFYAGVPYTVTVSGGLPPYLVTSSEQTLVELNFTTSDHEISFVPRNPGVVDVGLDPNEVLRRSVNIDVRDSAGMQISRTYNVLQNFFTGYRESYSNTCASGGAAATPPQACSGTDSIINLVPVSNGTLYGNREYQLDKVRGDFQFVVEDPSVTPQLVNQIRVRTDHMGQAHIRMRVTNNAPTQIASYKITDVSTGSTTVALFGIVQQPVVDTITLLPNTVTFTGTTSTRCGTGSADVFVSGGTPPYTLVASAGVLATPTTVDASGGRFTVSAGLTGTPCPTGTSVIVTDSRGATTILPVAIQPGTGSPPALTAAPSSLTLLCGQSGSVTVVGGTGSGLLANSSVPRVSAVVAGNTVSITRVSGDGGVNYPTSGTVTVTDGTSIVSIAVSGWLATCP